jgi:glucose/arabinose dehydrogenase
MNIRPLFALAVILLAAVSSSHGATATGFECRWTHDAITIDGRPAERAWETAQTIDRFRHTNEHAPRAATKVKLLWDRDHLYFYAEMEDADLYAAVTAHDGKVWTDDAFALFVKPTADKPGYYEFGFNPANAVMDCFMPRRDTGGYDRYHKEGEFGIESAVQLKGTLNNVADKDAGWSVEGRISWKSFLRTGGRPNPGDVWTCAPCRVEISVDFEGKELSSAAALKSKPLADFHSHEDYAPLKFSGPDDPASQPQVRYGMEKLLPLTTSTVVGSPDPPKPYTLVDAYPKLKVKFPVVVAHQPGSDRLWTVTQPFPWGKCEILRFIDDPDVDRYETLMPFDGIVYSIEFHPKFRQNGFVFVGRTGPWGDAARRSQIARYKVDPNPPYAVNLKSETVIIEWPSAGHDGAAMAFAADGTLFVSSGDGSGGSDTLLNGQNLTGLQSKILRIDIDHPDPGQHYSVPKDNPFVSQPGVRAETWAYGMRNPWRMAIDARNGNLWVGQNGQDLWESIYLIEKGANYGWSLFEGGHPFNLTRKQGPHPISKPIADHGHAEARSLTGGIVYYGKRFANLSGAYVYGDYSTGKLWAIRINENKQITSHQEIADTTAQPTSFALDSKGELLISDSGGHRFCRLAPVPAGTGRSDFPRSLSASGLFKDVKRHALADGVVPYSVNSELWSDGAYKERFIAIPHKSGDRRIGYTIGGGWYFPDETILIKSFAIEREAGNPASRRWIETRFFTKQEGEWAGYSYMWNEDQTDATLVESPGLDRDYEIRDAKTDAGVRTLKWRYPSRTECMICHSRAANYVLGVQTPQMNRGHDFRAIGGPIDNQLRNLEHLGMLRVNYVGETTQAFRDEAVKRALTPEATAKFMEQHEVNRLQRRDEYPDSSLLAVSPKFLPKLANPLDTSADLNARARSYLHANCAHCHVKDGGGNALMEMEFNRPPEQMQLFDVDPMHGRFEISNGKLVARGDPDRSILLRRMSGRLTDGHNGQMPPLATNVRDESAVALMKQWISQLPAVAPPTK